MKRPAICLLFILLTTASFSLTLKESIDMAVKNNPAVATSQKKLDAANARFNQAMGMFFPTIKLDANYGKAYTQPSTVQFTAAGVTQTLTFGTDAAATNKGLTASLTQPLFVAGLFPGFKIAQKGAELAKEDLMKTLIETQFNAANAYYGVLKAEKFYQLSEQAREMAQNHRDEVKTMLAAGA